MRDEGRIRWSSHDHVEFEW